MSVTETDSITHSNPCKNSKPLSVRAELKALLSLAIPIMGSQLAQTANGFVDAVMAGGVSPLDLAAVAVGSSIWVPVYLFMSGILLATTPFVAQLVGANEKEKIGAWVQQALWLALLISIIGFFSIRNADLLMVWLNVDQDISAPVGKIFRCYILGRNPNCLLCST